ncbi:MAG: GspH/FimT family pseudopilin [Verrucomicrobia bacterium]|nr:GspH/FimT family pseudopilin [Verrucomicrobiota bacterium]
MRMKTGLNEKWGRSEPQCDSTGSRFLGPPPFLCRGLICRRGFTLIEVLLATVLLLLLLGAVVFNFSSLEQGARLDEGASQFESLLRFARAHATSSGRQVQVSFQEEIEVDTEFPFASVHVKWEPDPLGQPGTFEDLPLTQPYQERLNDLVLVDTVRLIGPGTDSAASSDAAEADEAGDAEVMDFFPSITFYPDGSSDSARIVLVSRDEADRRRVDLRLVGVTGVTRRSVVDESGEMPEEEEPPPAESGSKLEVVTTTQPASESK